MWSVIQIKIQSLLKNVQLFGQPDISQIITDMRVTDSKKPLQKKQIGELVMCDIQLK